jgi:hypothetical protein
MAKITKDIYDISVIAAKAIQIKEILNDLDPAIATEVFSLVLAGRSNEEIRSVMDATKLRYTRMTGREVYDKIPKIKINISRA